MTSYLTSVDTILSILCRFRDIRLPSFRGFDLDLWPLEVTRGQKYLSPFESPYMTLYLTSIDTFSLSRTVLEIFDFQVFGVWPWPLTFRGHQRSKISLPFGMPMHDFLSNFYWHYSLYLVPFSRYSTSKFFGFWPWPLTFRGHQRSKIFSPFESSYMTSYLSSIDPFSLSRTVLEIFDFQVFGVWPWLLTFRGHQRSKIFITNRKPMHDFLSNFYLHILSISYSFRDIRYQNFWGQTKWRILTFSRSRSLTDFFHF